MACNPLVPELNCADFARSLAFYTGILGFAVAYARPEQSFAFLEREGAQLMLEQLEQPPRSARSWLTGEVAYPFGRGINSRSASATSARCSIGSRRAAGRSSGRSRSAGTDATTRSSATFNSSSRTLTGTS